MLQPKHWETDAVYSRETNTEASAFTSNKINISNINLPNRETNSPDQENDSDTVFPQRCATPNGEHFNSKETANIDPSQKSKETVPERLAEDEDTQKLQQRISGLEKENKELKVK